MQNPMLVNSPGGSMQAAYRCLPTSLSLRGVEFKVSPIVLRASVIDVILGMDWMKQQQAVIQYQEKVVVVTAPNGDRISVDVVVQAQPTAIVNQLDDRVNKEDQWWMSFQMCSPMTCQVCHLTVTLSLLLNYYLELHL